MKIRLPVFVAIFFFLPCILTSRAEDLSAARSSFYQGNANYSKGDFPAAIANYEKVLKAGFESGALYYNIGNAYFKNGSLGKAILNYLRAERLKPNDSDVKSNLAYAQSLLKVKTAEPPPRWFLRPFWFIADSFSLDALTLINLLWYMMLSAGLVTAILVKKRRLYIYLSISLSLVLAVFSFAFFLKLDRIVLQKEAVVVIESAEAKFEPFEGGTTFFSLSEGEVVFIITQEETWVRVRRLDGKQGWLKKTEIELL